MPKTQDVQRAAAALRQGQLVAFPTETVYGLGADAENVAAIARIFAVKGRPTNHPLIVHLASASEMASWASRVPDAAWRLAEACWPGPLTLLLPRGERVPLATTGGLPSVGLRVPAHPVALELLRQFGGGIAAPSANRFGRVSPTSAAHVESDLGEDVDMLLDGGECDVGVESTIVDLTRETPVLLRPGGVSAHRIESLLGVQLGRIAPPEVRAPGMLASHYAPLARVELLPAAQLAQRARELLVQGERVTVLASARDAQALPAEAKWIDLGESDSVAAQRLYASLRRADNEGASVVLTARASEPRGLEEALVDRLTKAAAPRSGH